jgi:hypothetical protein
MFQPLIEQARTLIQRLHASAERGRDAVPEAMLVRASELEAWDTASRGIVSVLLGADAVALARWSALNERRGMLVGAAMQKDIKRGEYIGLIDYFHLAIGVLLEFEAMYQHRLAALAPAPLHATVALADPRAPQDQDGLVRLAPQAPPDEPRPAARAVDGRWELTIAVNSETYQWLDEVGATREPNLTEDGAAAARLAGSIVERVAANKRYGK